METMRDRFSAVATELLDTDSRIVLLLADIGADRFAAAGAAGRHPKRLRNLGIREQVLIGVAAGHASKVSARSFIPTHRSSSSARSSK